VQGKSPDANRGKKRNNAVNKEIEKDESIGGTENEGGENTQSIKTENSYLKKS